MSHNSYSGTPSSSKAGLNSSKSLFHDFVRPRGQFSTKLGTSPFKGSPQTENFDFIPLSFSSPVNSMHKNGGRNWKGHNSRNFVGSPANSSWNHSFGSYSMNRNHFRNSSSWNSNSSYSPYSSRDTPKKHSSKGKKMGNNVLGNMKNTDDVSLYYHPSMLEDPWAELEQKLKNSTRDCKNNLCSKDTLEKCCSNLSNADTSVSDSDEGTDSQQTDSSVVGSDGSS